MVIIMIYLLTVLVLNQLPNSHEEEVTQKIFLQNN